MKFYAALSLPILALANPVFLPSRTLEERQNPAVPVQIPTGTACQGVPAASPVTDAQLAAAVAPCIGVQAAGSDFTRNDVVNGVCKKETFIFARGTTEDPNLGNIVGPPFLTALNAVFGGSKNVAAQGVNNYAAIGAEYCAGGSLTGAQNLADVSLVNTNSTELYHQLTSFREAHHPNPNQLPQDQTPGIGLQPRRPSRAQRFPTPRHSEPGCREVRQRGRNLRRPRSQYPARQCRKGQVEG